MTLREQVLRFDDIYLKFREGRDVDASRQKLRSVLTESDLSQGNIPFCESTEFLRAIGSAIFYHVSTEFGYPNAALMVDFVSEAVRLLGNRIGDISSKLNFDAVTGLDRAYWIGRQNRLEHVEPESNSIIFEFPLLRINNLPFAEDVYGELMALHSIDARHRKTAHNIATVPLPWNKVGVGLRNQFIDAAIYNDSIFASLESYKNKIGLWESDELFKYRHYPVLQNLSVSNADANLIAVPAETDLEKVFHEVEKDPARSRRVGTGSAIQIKDLRPMMVESSDRALEDLVNRRCGLALVGAVHAAYAEKRFAGISKHSFFESSHGGTSVRFYTIRHTAAEATQVLQPLIVAWNEAAKRVDELLRYPSTVLPSGLLERLNLRPKRVFVDDANTLTSLIGNHNVINLNVRTAVQRSTWSSK